MQLREYLIRSLNRDAPPYQTHIVDQFIRLYDARDRWLEEHNYIDIQYTDDEFGEAAKEFGIPQHAYPGDAGMDLPIVFSRREREDGITLYPDQRTMLHTGIKTAFPGGYWGLIIHRSSTEFRQRLRVVEGVIDDYRGELLVHAHNTNSTMPVVIEHGQKLGQLILIKTASFKGRVVSVLRPSERGASGFGSTGAKAMSDTA